MGRIRPPRRPGTTGARRRGPGGAALAPVQPLADDAAAEERDAEDEDQADHHRDEIADRREVVLQADHQGGADERPDQGADAAEQRHQHHLGRGVQRHVVERDEAEDQGLEGAGIARHRRREHEGEELEAGGVVAERHRPRLVVAHRLEDLAEGRMHHPVDEQEAGDEERERHVVHRRVAGEVDEAEQRAPRDALQAVLAAGPAELHRQEVDDLRQGQRDHREVDAAAPDRQAADGKAHESRRRDARREGDRHPERMGAEPDHQRAGDVAGGAQEGGVGEGDEAGEAEQQVEGAGEQPVGHHLHDEDRVDQPRHQRHHEEPGDEGGEQVSGVHLTPPARTGRPGAGAAPGP